MAQEQYHQLSHNIILKRKLILRPITRFLKARQWTLHIQKGRLFQRHILQGQSHSWLVRI